MLPDSLLYVNKRGNNPPLHIMNDQLHMRSLCQRIANDRRTAERVRLDAQQRCSNSFIGRWQPGRWRIEGIDFAIERTEVEFVVGIDTKRGKIHPAGEEQTIGCWIHPII